jgi:hypothetical protein
MTKPPRAWQTYLRARRLMEDRDHLPGLREWGAFTWSTQPMDGSHWIEPKVARWIAAKMGAEGTSPA